LSRKPGVSTAASSAAERSKRRGDFDACALPHDALDPSSTRPIPPTPTTPLLYRLAASNRSSMPTRVESPVVDELTVPSPFK
jgi:hypothetical protein